MVKRSEEEERLRRLRFYQDRMEYITKYREGDVLYHATLKENIPSLLRDGFDPAHVGTGGGCQGGIGFSGAWCEADAWDWGQKLYGWNNEHRLAVLKVSLPGLKLASQQQCDEMGPEITPWAKAEGYLQLAENGKYDPTPKLETLYQNSPEFANVGWALTGLYVLAKGYDGYFVGIDEVVIMNFAILTPEAFSLCP